MKGEGRRKWGGGPGHACLDAGGGGEVGGACHACLNAGGSGGR